MAQPVTIRGGKVRIMLGSGVMPIVYEAPCGFTSRSITWNKALEEVSIPDCEFPDAADWLSRDVSSLSISVSGEGVMAEESKDAWFEAWESVESVPVRIEIEWPTQTDEWTGNMHIESLEATAANGQRVTLNVSMQSDGQFLRSSTPAT